MNVRVWLVLIVGRLCMSTARRGPHHPRGETPVSERHHHYRPHAGTPLTQDSQLLHDTQHLAEDSRVLTQEALDAMSTDELEFHYFTTHDFDSNNKLDGLELLKAVYHTMDHQDEEGDKPLDADHNDIDTYIELVDRTLKSDDKNGDGYVCYAEYRAVRAKRSRDKIPKTPVHHDHSQQANDQIQDQTYQDQAHQAQEQDEASHDDSRTNNDEIQKSLDDHQAHDQPHDTDKGDKDKVNYVHDDKQPHEHYDTRK